MIHFNFYLTDVDAENLFDIINDRIAYNNEIILEMMDACKDKTVIEAYKRDIEYLKNLKSKLKNTRVESER